MRQSVFTTAAAIAIFAGAIQAAAVSPYPVLSQRAERFYQQHEWNQAAAVYGLMLDEQPQRADTYGRAIVVNGMRGDHQAQNALMARALDNHVPFDSVFSRVRAYSFSLGKTNLYADFLTGLKAEYPWMKRTINSYLLQYYTFRRNGAEMLQLSNDMLAGAPGNIGFLRLSARGALYDGDTAQAMVTYRHILELDPDNFEALCALGNYHTETGEKAQALVYLERAYALHPTPYIAHLLETLY